GREALEVAVQVVTTLDLRAGEPFLRVRSEVDNRAHDHRLRAHFPLPARVSGSTAECAFAVVERGLEAEGGPQEAALPTFPARRFVDCSDGVVGLAVISDGLMEYELVNGGTELAVTLLRSVGYLSRLEPALRPNPAGPPVPVEGAQMPGRVVRDYALALHRGGWEEAQLPALADAALSPLELAWGASPTSPAELALQGAGLRVDGAEVSAVGRDLDGALWVRLCRMSDAPGVARVAVGTGEAVGCEVDLLGRPGRSFAGSMTLRPWEILTLRLDEASLR
ncbi:MAG: glycoside hydrolase family 38 C-terminal domain-containing protein, partial [Acidimicrobiia bacterium]